MRETAQSAELCASLAACLVLSGAPSLRAAEPATSPSAGHEEEGGPYEAVVRAQTAEDGLDAQRRLDANSPGFATAIELEHETGARPSDALPEVLARASGATVRSLGGLGQFTSVSLRGSSAQQVAVFLDGVPLGSSAGGLVDLSSLPLDVLDRVEVFRGYVPIAFGSAAVGGVINLVTKQHRGPARISGQVGGGSFGAQQVSAALRTELLGDDGLRLQAGLGRATGNFRFYDTNRAPAFPERHTWSERTNNGFQRGVGQLAYQIRRGAWRLQGRQIALVKEQQLPGRGDNQASDARLGTVDLHSMVTVRRVNPFGPGSLLHGLVGFNVQRRHLQDPPGGARDDEVSAFVSTTVSPRVRLPLWEGAFARASLDLRHEWTGVDDRLRTNPSGQQTTGDASRQRLSAGAGVELQQFLLAGRGLVVPAFRVDYLDSRFEVAPGQGELADKGRNITTWGISPRLGARLRLLEPLELRASVGRYLRPPNLTELFGDRGFMIGNEGLVAEEGTSIDGGAVLDWGGPGNAGVYVQAAVFATWADNLIQWRQTNLVLRPENVPGATLAGLETSLAAHLLGGQLRGQANYTYLFAERHSRSAHEQGERLPGRPEHELFARISAGMPSVAAEQDTTLRVFYNLDFISGTFLDPSGRRLLPSRILHGAGMELEVSGWLRAAIEVRNLTDERVTTWDHPAVGLASLSVPLSDFVGYPLPGRSLWLSLAVDLALTSTQRR